MRVGPGWLEVGDDGPGVPEAEQAHLFDLFWRGQGQGDGHGLGMSIVQQVAQLHDAELTVSVPPGFVVRLVFPEVAIVGVAG